jgi:type III secretion protein U
MSQQDDSGDKTEKPTPKKLRDARKRGDVPKSKDLSHTIGTFFWLLVFGSMAAVFFGQFRDLFDAVFNAIGGGENFRDVLLLVSIQAVVVFAVVGLLPALLAGVIGTLTEFLQVRGVLALEKVKPDLKHLNPVEGVKKIFSSDNVIEVVKSALKAVLLVTAAILLARHHAQDLYNLMHGHPAQAAALWWQISKVLVTWVLVFFVFFSLGDALLQHHKYIKKLMMSMREIKQEYKEDEGDPHIKQKRKQMHNEWAQQNMKKGVRRANVVVTNPTHLAVALHYEKGETVVPMVTAKGEDDMARLIRETAEEEDIPILRNVALARALYDEVPTDDYIPLDLFEAVAQVLLWAQDVKDGRQRELPPGSEPPVV